MSMLMLDLSGPAITGSMFAVFSSAAGWSSTTEHCDLDEVFQADHTPTKGR
jgi:hypothetical protein